MTEQCIGSVERAEHRFSHAVVNKPEYPGRSESEGPLPEKNHANAPLDTPDRFEAAAASDIRSPLTPTARWSQARTLSSMRPPPAAQARRICSRRSSTIAFARFERALGFDEMPVFGGCDSDRSVGRCERELSLSSRKAKRRGFRAAEDQRHEACR